MRMENSIREKLAQAFAPAKLQVVNDSHHHAGHASSPGTGESHFSVMVVSEAFAGKSRLERHRMGLPSRRSHHRSAARRREVQDAAHSRLRNALSLAIGTSRSTKASPMPRTSTSASLPPFTFLSCAIS